MTHESEIYVQEINRLKEKVNKLIHIVESASDDFYDPAGWKELMGIKPRDLDKEVENKYIDG